MKDGLQAGNSRAFLLNRFLQGGDKAVAATAGLFGYKKEDDSASETSDDSTASESNTGQGQESEQTSGGSSGSGSGTPAPRAIRTTTDYPKMVFLRATETDMLTLEELKADGPAPTDDELAEGLSFTTPPGPELMPWSRLGTALKRRLGRPLPGNLDHRRLLREVGRGRPILHLPRLSRLAWAPDLVVIRDDTEAMYPFQVDTDALLARLQRERGTAGLLKLRWKGRLHDWKGRLLDPHKLSALPPGTPVLALSDLGQYHRRGSRIQRAWQALAHHLTQIGHPLHALVPCPRNRWTPELAAAWNAVYWDHAARPPRHGGQAALPPIVGAEKEVDALLTRLSATSRVDAPLLRRVRLLCPQADVGTEHDAWTHPDCWTSTKSFGFTPGEAYDQRLHARRDLTDADRAPIDTAIRLQADTYAKAQRLITELRLRLSAEAPDQVDAATLEDITTLLQGVQRRLVPIASEPNGAEGATSRLPEWIDATVARLPPDLRDHPAVTAALSTSLGLAHRYLDEEAPDLPPGIDPQRYNAGRYQNLHSEPRDFRVCWLGDHLSLATESDEGWANYTANFTASFTASVGQRISVSIRPSVARLGKTKQLTIPAQGPLPLLPLLSVQPGDRVTLLSDRQRLELIAADRSLTANWAEEMGLDQHGLWAAFTRSGVRFKMRWIPPGRFTMGSPDDEPGRYDREGPQHLVTIRNGFWLGETPVTQAQWRVVAERNDNSLKPNPSRFKGYDDLPVEQVSWDDCQSYLDVLRNMNLGFLARFPTEAEWEYACRAGTETALYAGPIEILGERNAPALDPIAWYGGNSEVDPRIMENAYDSSGWPEKQFPHRHAGTQRVKTKRGNPWGLYDMLGNVFEWCYDYRRDYTDQAVVDPVGSLQSARRAIRGGSWLGHARNCRSAYRAGLARGFALVNLGLRLAAGPEPTESAQEQEQEKEKEKDQKPVGPEPQ